MPPSINTALLFGLPLEIRRTCNEGNLQIRILYSNCSNRLTEMLTMDNRSQFTCGRNNEISLTLITHLKISSFVRISDSIDAGDFWVSFSEII